METRRLLQHNHPLAKTPSKAFDHDIAKYVQDTKTNGYPVLLFMDANSGYGERDNRDLERQTGLVNVIQYFHPDLEMSRTYDRGRNCIHIVLGCKHALQLIKKCGYMEFYALTPDDNRAMFVDLDTDLLQQKHWFAPSATLVAPSLKKTSPSGNIPSPLQGPP